MKRSLRVIFGFFFLAALVGVLNLPARACSCAPPPPPEEVFPQTPVVFIGRDVGGGSQEVHRDQQWQERTYDSQEIDFEVEESFRGVTAGQRVTIHSDLGSCSSLFLRGERYLVYGYIDQRTGEIDTWVCTRTRFLGLTGLKGDDGDAELTFLRRVIREPEGTTISGTVSDQSRVRTDGKTYGLGKITLTFATDDGVKYETKTDETGAFRVEGMKAGQYRLKMALPAGYQYSNGTEYEIIEIYERGERTVNPEVSSTSRISGRLVDADSSPIRSGSGVRLTSPIYLFACDESGKLIQENNVDMTVSLDADGAFEFTKVPEGSYLLKVGAVPFSSDLIPIPKSYYPGTPDASKAEILRVGLGKSFENLTFRLQERLPRYDVIGVAIDSGGKPVAGLDVSLLIYESPGKRPDAWDRAMVTKTDANGRFTLFGYPGKAYGILLANHPLVQNTDQSAIVMFSPIFRLTENRDKMVLVFDASRPDPPTDETSDDPPKAQR